jgi:hypothetical protein
MKIELCFFGEMWKYQLVTQVLQFDMLLNHSELISNLYVPLLNSQLSVFWLQNVFIAFIWLLA